jgi:hypothetical protein
MANGPKIVSDQTLSMSGNDGTTPDDDLVHTCPPDVPRWTENIQWNVRDDAGLGVIWHLGTMLRDPSLWHIVVALTLPDGTVYATKLVARGNGAFGTDNACMTTVEPFRRWRFIFRGGMVHVTDHARASRLIADDHHLPVAIELELSAAYPVWIPEGSDSYGDWGRFHHEQAVRAAGTVVIESTTFQLHGIGHRDHSIGPRDMSQLRRAYWGNGIFESGWAFATMQGEYVHNRFERAAIFDSDGTHTATMIRWNHLESPRGDPYQFSLEMDVSGRSIVIDGSVRAGMNFTVVDGAEFCLGTDLTRPDRYVLTNLFVDWTCDGERGIGYLDRGALIELFGEERHDYRRSHSG